MQKTESVMVSVSIIVTAPVGELSETDMVDKLQEAFLGSVAKRLGSSVPALEDEPWFEQDLGSSYHYLSPTSPFPEKNAARCARCGLWTSDCEAPDFLIMLGVGRIINGKLVCGECRVWGDEPNACDAE